VPRSRRWTCRWPGGKPEAFQKVVVRADAAIYAKIIKDANIRLGP
jgi:hypothetical protein